MKKDPLNTLMQWYADQCDGKWEHGYGIRIETLDNPGWGLKINLKNTPFENLTMDKIFIDKSKNDWIFCEIKDKAFLGNGDLHKLENMINIFIDLIQANSKKSNFL